MLDLSPQNLISDPTAGLKVLDLEFVMPYADFPSRHRPPRTRGPTVGCPPRGREHRAPAAPLTRGVGNSVFHPAVAGLPIERLLGPARRGDAPAPRRDPAGLVRGDRDGRTAARAPAARPVTPTVASEPPRAHRTVRGFVWAFTGSAGQAVLQIAATIVLARLLTPHEFGSVAAALLVVGLAQLLTQVGVSAALVQRRELADDDVSAAFAFSVLVALVLAIALAVGAPVLSPLVGLPADSGLLPLLAPTLLLAGVAAVPSGLLQRRLQFRPLAVVDLIAAGPAMIGVSVALALAGFGAYALAWASVVAGAVTAIGRGAAER